MQHICEENLSHILTTTLTKILSEDDYFITIILALPLYYRTKILEFYNKNDNYNSDGGAVHMNIIRRI